MAWTELRDENTVALGAILMGFVVDRVAPGRVSALVLRISSVVVVPPVSRIDIYSSAVGAVCVTLFKFSRRTQGIKIMFGV